MSSYNIIVIHIWCTGLKIVDAQKAAAKAAMQPQSRKRNEKESSDEDFSDEREGKRSEAESEDDGELAAKIAVKERQLALAKEDLMCWKKVVEAPAAVINASRAIRPTSKEKGVVELIPAVCSSREEFVQQSERVCSTCCMQWKGKGNKRRGCSGCCRQGKGKGKG